MKYVTVSDGGETVVVDTGKYGNVYGVACIMSKLGTPQSVIARVDSTTSMMGSQHAEVDGITYDWSYHPDNGLNMVITEVS